MITILLIVMSIVLIATGNMPIAGGKRLKGLPVRIGGLLMFVLSSSLIFLPTDYFIIMVGIIFVLGAVPYFFAKGEEPTEEEKKSSMWDSKDDEMATYKETAKNIGIVGLGIAGIYFVAMAAMKIVSLFAG